MKSMWLSIALTVVFSVSASSYRTVATIPVGDTPNDIAITPDGKFAYVANQGGNVTVLNLMTNTVVTTINDASFSAPYTATMNPAGTKVYITNVHGTVVTIISVATNTVIDTITGFQAPSGMVIMPNGITAYVTNFGVDSDGTSVSVVNLNSNTVTGTIYVGLAPAALAITPDGAYVYVSNYGNGNAGTGTVSIIKTSTNQVIKTLMGFSGPYFIAITPDGSKAYVTNFGSYGFVSFGTTVMVINTRSNTILTTIPLGMQPCGIAATPNGNFVYVSHFDSVDSGSGIVYGQGPINIINTQNQQVLGRVLVAGRAPTAIAINPDGTRAYVANYADDTVTVIDITDDMWLNV